MSQPPIITSTANPRIVEARKLAQRKHREAQGRFLAEGLQILHMALDAGARPREVFYCEALFAGQEAPRLIARFPCRGGRVTPSRRMSCRVSRTASSRRASWRPSSCFRRSYLTWRSGIRRCCS